MLEQLRRQTHATIDLGLSHELPPFADLHRSVLPTKCKITCRKFVMISAGAQNGNYRFAHVAAWRNTAKRCNAC
jgi:hypothetical protein